MLNEFPTHLEKSGTNF